MKEFVVPGFDSRQLAYRRDDGRVELVQPMRLAPVGAATGAASGAVLGMLVLAPVLFPAVGAVAGAAGAGLSALGLNQLFLHQVRETLEPGRAALFVLVSGGTDQERAIKALAPLAPRVLRTNLEPAAEQRLLGLRRNRSSAGLLYVAVPTSFGVTDPAVHRRGGREWMQPTS